MRGACWDMRIGAPPAGNLAFSRFVTRSDRPGHSDEGAGWARGGRGGRVAGGKVLNNSSVFIRLLLRFVMVS